MSNEIYTTEDDNSIFSVISYNQEQECIISCGLNCNSNRATFNHDSIYLYAAESYVSTGGTIGSWLEIPDRIMFGDSYVDANYDLDSRYYTESEIDNKLSLKLDTSESDKLYELLESFERLAEAFTITYSSSGDITNIQANAGLSSISYISALGTGESSSSGSSGLDISAMWEALASNTNDQINSSHLTNSLSNYITSAVLTSTLSSYLTTSTAASTYATQTALSTANSNISTLQSYFTSGVANKSNLLNGYASSQIFNKNCYHYSNGMLVKTDIERGSAAMCIVEIKGNSYSSKSLPIDTKLQFYSYSTTDSFISYTGINNSYPIDSVNVFYLDDVVCFWIASIGNYTSWGFKVWRGQDVTDYNRVVSISNTTMPDEAEKTVTIYPSISALTTDNVASATKLATTRIIWGQSFDGSTNVSGALTDVTTITATSSITAASASINGQSVTSTKITLWDKISALFDIDDDGNVYVKDNKGFYSNSFISAMGNKDSSNTGTSGLDLSAMWEALATSDSMKVIDISHIPTLSISNISSLQDSIDAKLNISNISSWALATTRPSYSYSEITGLVSELANYATITYVDSKITELIGTAPENLDTLQEIAAALENSDSVVAGIITTLATKLDISTATSTYATITNLATANSKISTLQGYFTSSTANKAYILTAIDDRDVLPDTTGIGSGVKGVKPFFVSKISGSGSYSDLLVLDTYSDTSGGKTNALEFNKSTPNIYHYQATQTSDSWGTGYKIWSEYNCNNLTVDWTANILTANSASIDGALVTSTKIALWDKISALFDIDNDGNVYVKDNKGFYSNSFISAMGNKDSNDTSTSGLDLSAMWEALVTSDSTKVIDVSHIPTLSIPNINSLQDTLDAKLNSATAASTYATQTALTYGLAAKLDSSSYTASDILTKLKTVDGSGSGLDADTLDGLENGYLTTSMFRRYYDNISNLGEGSNSDANMLTTGGMIWNYYGSNNWHNAPTGMSYGSILHLTCGASYSGIPGALSGQFAWDITHNSTSSTRYLWFRAANNLGFQDDWKQIALHGDDVSFGTITATGGISSNSYISALSTSSTSDMRMKDNIESICSVTDFISSMDIFSHTWRGADGKTVGISAQWLQDTDYNYLVHEIENKLSVDYKGLQMLAFVGLQETNSEIDNLKQEIKELKTEVKQLKNRLWQK